ncbi:MAG: hypothetical protein H0W87_04460 [Actinobacteria bacterium]|nr:hypothetical protein [Actinomycetota bacterium]
MSTEPQRRPRPPRRRRLRRGRLLVGAALLIVVFLLGIAFGQALHDNPKPGESTTFVRTFFPLAPKTTVTVTTSQH